MSIRQDKVKGELMKYVATYIEHEATRQSLISVTDASVSPDLKKATIFITVFPEKEENTAVLFLKRKRPEIRAFIRKQFQAKTIPFIDIEIDRGEKNRQHIESLEREIRDNDAQIGK